MGFQIISYHCITVKVYGRTVAIKNFARHQRIVMSKCKFPFNVSNSIVVLMLTKWKYPNIFSEICFFWHKMNIQRLKQEIVHYDCTMYSSNRFSLYFMSCLLRAQNVHLKMVKIWPSTSQTLLMVFRKYTLVMHTTQPSQTKQINCSRARIPFFVKGGRVLQKTCELSFDISTEQSKYFRDAYPFLINYVESFSNTFPFHFIRASKWQTVYRL